MKLGIEKIYKITKKVQQDLILNDKVVDYLLSVINKKQYVYMTGSSTYKQVTKDLLNDLLKKAEQDDHYWNIECFAVVADYPEYENVPFEVSHASPYDHRWPGDYDKDAYDDWKIDAVSLSDLLYADTWDNEPIYIKKPDMFDFKEEKVLTSKEKLEDIHSYY